MVGAWSGARGHWRPLALLLLRCCHCYCWALLLGAAAAAALLPPLLGAAAACRLWPASPRPLPAHAFPLALPVAAVEYIAAFLLLTTWLVPFAFFLGMSGDNAVLPGVSEVQQRWRGDAVLLQTSRCPLPLCRPVADTMVRRPLGGPSNPAALHSAPSRAAGGRLSLLCGQQRQQRQLATAHPQRAACGGGA